MKKHLVALALIILITPSVTFAVWWNPSTWFSRIDEMNFDYNKKVGEKKQPQKKISNIVPNQTPVSISTPLPEIKTTFYVKHSDSKVRSCASTECEILGYYQVNDQIISTDSKHLTLKDMPTWIMFNLPNGKTAYINKSVLSEISVVEKQDMHLSDLNNYIDTLISNYEKLLEYAMDMKESSEFYEGNFRKAKSMFIQAIDGGTFDTDFEEIMNLFIESYIDPAIKRNSTYQYYFQHYIDTETSIIAELQMEKRNNIQSNLVSAEEFLSNYNRLKKRYGDNIDQHKSAFTDSFDKFIIATKKDQSKMSEMMDEMKAALDVRYSRQADYYKNATQYNPSINYQPISYPQIQMPKTTYCTMNGGLGGNYSIICN